MFYRKKEKKNEKNCRIYRLFRRLGPFDANPATQRRNPTTASPDDFNGFFIYSYFSGVVLTVH